MAKRRRDILRARRSVPHFIEYAIPHERTQAVVKNAPHHLEWQDILSKNKRAVIMAAVEHAKTQQIAVGKTLHMMGKDPNLRGAIVSNTALQAEKILRSIRNHIDRNPLVRDVFPGLKRSTEPGDPWHQSMLTVERDTVGAKDPTVQGLGVQGPINGSRLDWAILDDVLDFENTRTPEQRAKILDWFDAVLMARLTDGAICWVIGMPWHHDDLLHVLSKRKAWHFSRTGAVKNPDDPPEQWIPTWLRKPRILEIHGDMAPRNFARKYLCRVRMDDSSRFVEAWINKCVAQGRGWSMMDRAPVTPGGQLYKCFTGVDLGVGQDEANDLTVLFTIALDQRFRRIVASIEAGRWKGAEVIRRIFSVQQRFNSIVTVENNAAQDFLLQWAGSSGVAVEPFRTGASNKFDEAFGVESLAVEFRAAQWIIPSGLFGEVEDEEVRLWIQEMLLYSPEAHTGDRLMASWFARESARKRMAGMMGHLDTQTR